MVGERDTGTRGKGQGRDMRKGNGFVTGKSLSGRHDHVVHVGSARAQQGPLPEGGGTRGSRVRVSRGADDLSVHGSERVVSTPGPVGTPRKRGGHPGTRPQDLPGPTR